MENNQWQIRFLLINGCAKTARLSIFPQTHSFFVIGRIALIHKDFPLIEKDFSILFQHVLSGMCWACSASPPIRPGICWMDKSYQVFQGLSIPPQH